jgi:hypothetical protein
MYYFTVYVSFSGLGAEGFSLFFSFDAFFLGYLPSFFYFSLDFLFTLFFPPFFYLLLFCTLEVGFLVGVVYY